MINREVFLYLYIMKLDKLVYDIRERLSQYQDDSNITNEYITYLIGIYREKILKNELNNYQMIVSPMVIQSFCLELEEVSAYDCGIDFNCEKILRTKRPIPKPIKSHIGPAITSVKPVSKMARSFSLVEKEGLPYFMNGKYNTGIYYYLDNDMHIYFISKQETLKLMECVYVSGVFSDPFELVDYTDECACNVDNPTTCFNELEMDYPITGDHIADIANLVIEVLINKLQIPEDKNNNANDN